MSSTNKTTNLQLSQFHANDTPKWLQDYNADMAKIDNHAGQVATSDILGHVKHQDILNMVYPVGSIYESTSNTSPASFIGGTWEIFGSGEVLVGVSSDFPINTAGGTRNKSFGAGDLFAQANIQLYNSYYAIQYNNKTGITWQRTTYDQCAATQLSSNAGENATMNRAISVGGRTATEEIMPPYRTVYRWRRTA